MSLHMDIVKNFGTFRLSVKLDAENEVVGLLGASGCGKSATLRCIAGLITPDSGHIEVNGTVLFDSEKGINVKTRDRRTAMLFQNYQLFPNMTVLDNVMAGIPRDVPKHERRERAEHYLEMFSLKGFGGRYPMRLSGGQQQRVALARMLAARPSILMFDEPFSALDSHLKSSLQQSMLDTFDDVDTTIIYVSHDIDEALRFCDRIAVIDRGEIVQTGSGRDIVDHPSSLATLRLSGCSNTSAARKVGEGQIEATDWGLRFTARRDVPDDLAYVGIRPFYIRQADEDERGDPNVYRLHVHRVDDSRFERTVMLDTPGNNPDSRIMWQVNTIGVEDASSLPQTGDDLLLAFDVDNLYLVRG
jgi:molybdate transport system ATP-binding protein